MRFALFCFRNRGHLLISSLVLLAGIGSVNAQGLQTTYGNNGLATLTYNGVTLTDTGVNSNDAFNIYHYQTLIGGVTADRYDTSAGLTKSWDSANKILTWSYSWGSVKTAYTATSTRLNVVITVSNTSSNTTINGLNIFPLCVRFPNFPAGYNTWDPHANYNTDGPSVQIADYGTGVVDLCNDDVVKPLYTGFFTISGDTASYKRYSVWVASTPLNSQPSNYPLFNRPIAPGGTDTYTISLRFAPSGTDGHTLATDIYTGFASAWPYQTNWPDRRSMGALFLSTSSGTHTANNPRGWFNNDPSVDITTPSGISAFQTRMLQMADDSVAETTLMNSQAVIVWDLEGQQYPQPGFAYVGDPRLLPTLAPEMDPIADQFFQKFKTAGLKVGITLRPTLLNTSVNPPAQTNVADIAALLEAKIAYAKQRWNCTVYYIDSNGLYNEPIDASIIKAVSDAYPGVLLIPEHENTKYGAYSAPYQTLSNQDIGTLPDVARVYPSSFVVDYVADGDLDANHTVLVNSVRRGDVLLYRGWYADPQNAKIQSIYSDANAGKPSISSATTASGTTGQSFAFQVTASNGPTSYSATSIPPGVSLNVYSGLLSGIPNTAGTYTSTVSATNSYGTGSGTLTITIAAGGPVPWITSSAVAGQRVNTAFSYQISGTNSPTSYGASGLPAGLAVNTTTGLVSGTPTVVATTNITVIAYNANGAGTKTVTITITGAVAESPYGGTAWAIPGTVQSENFDNGGEGVAYHDTDSSNIGGGYRLDTGVDISTCADTGGGYEVGWGATGEWLKYTINAVAGSYNLNVRLQTGVTSAATLHFELDGSNVTGSIAVPNNGWGNYQTLTHPGVNFTAGQHIIRLYYEGPNFNVNWFSASTGTSAPWISSPASAAQTVNVPFSYQATGTNSPSSFSAQGLPTGLTLNTSTGWITGTVTTTGTWSVVLSATNSGGTDTLLLTITINPAVAESPYSGTAVSVPGQIEAENYDKGGEAVAFHDTDSTNIGGLYRNDGVDIGASGDTGGGYQIGWSSTGEWLKYMVNNTVSGSHTISLRVENGAFASQTIRVEVDGVNVTGSMAMPNTGWGVWATVTSPIFTMTTGAHTLRMYFEGSNVNVNWLRVN
jgi:hypothetical protein